MDQKFEPLADPLSAMLERLSGEPIFAAEKGSADTALNAVHNLDIGRIDDFRAG